MSQNLRGALPFDAVPFGIPLPEGNGVIWEDPREIHRVTVHFEGSPPPLNLVRLEYWGSWWPDRHLPKDREPGGGDVGWMELGNWWKYDWRTADTEAVAGGDAITFSFRPVNAKEYPKLKDYPADFRYTLKLRIVSDSSLPRIRRMEAWTDSQLEQRAFRLVWTQGSAPRIGEVFNGRWVRTEAESGRRSRFLMNAVVNPDPNTFDRTLVTVHRGPKTFTFKYDDLVEGPLFLPDFGVAVLADGDMRDYAALANEQKTRNASTLYDRVAELPEQTWKAAWEGMPPKKSHIYFPMGLDGGRQRFRLNADGSLNWRSNDHYLKNRPGRDTPRLDLENGDGSLEFGLPSAPTHRTLQEETLPICITTWNKDGVEIEQTALVTQLKGTRAGDPTPPADAFAVMLMRFNLTNTTSQTKTLNWPLTWKTGGRALDFRAESGWIYSKDRVRGQWTGNASFFGGLDSSTGAKTLGPGESRSIVLKIPYLVLTQDSEREQLGKLDFETERKAVADYWRRRLNESAVLVTPEPMLNDFYRSHAMHLLVNCEREPDSDRRFARVGSFSYGAYGNESCMMVTDLERRGYHKEAQDCLDAWLHYQGTVALPGSFAGKEGVLYGAGGYEAGGYNQHHGWILWMLAEHFRFTRDEAWLRRAAPGILKGAEWIINETARTTGRHELERGLLPAGSLEDIGDWWTWLSTSCYTWRGLDNAAWALAQIRHPEAVAVRRAADDYHRALIAHFTKAMERSPVVRLRNGTAVPKVPSHVHRRGRSFGWICETLEGSIHLLITKAIDPDSQLGTWILQDYEDNLYLSNQYGYTLDDFERFWFSRGGMSMQACLLLDVEPYLYRDDVKHALRALFNGQAVSYFPDVRLNTEHALPEMGDWRGDHFKSSDESNCAGWLRYLFVREDNEQTLLIGQAIPREWLATGRRCGIEKTATWFGPVSVVYTGGTDEITCQLGGPRRNPPKEIRLRFRDPQGRLPVRITVDGRPWKKSREEWVNLPGNVGDATVRAHYSR
ncbi:MAG TPA: hypothetical protein P5055_04970 [Candidatus Paceibacterota bacterium]|nr:hypothetical protein [Verrucomicrobiota bacterium]HSA00073.1 hypothetical protein [Candidatus Paceibacterota bacterium]